MRFFSDVAETEKWREVLRCADEIGERADSYDLDHDSTAEALRARLEADNEILGYAAKLKTLLAPVVADIKSTEMFRLCSEIDREIRPTTEKDRAKWRAIFRGIRSGGA